MFPERTEMIVVETLLGKIWSLSNYGGFPQGNLIIQFDIHGVKKWVYAFALNKIVRSIECYVNFYSKGGVSDDRACR